MSWATGMMNVDLDLSVHCIETELKRHYRQTVSAYFKASESDKHLLEPVIEALRLAVETTDFPCLRATHPVLAGGMDTEALFNFSKMSPVIIADNVEIDLPRKA